MLCRNIKNGKGVLKVRIVFLYVNGQESLSGMQIFKQRSGGRERVSSVDV